MTTLTPTMAPTPTGGVATSKLGDVLRCERTKFRTVASSWWTLLTVLVGTVAIGLITCWAVVAHWDQMSLAEKATLDPTFKSLIGLFIGQVAVGILGALAITSEYATGMIRTTFAAVPRRRAVLAAKAAALVVPAFVVSTVGCVLAFLSGQAILNTKSAGVSLTDPTVLRAVLGGGLYLTLLALFGLGLGAIFRRTAGAIAAFIGLVLVLPVVFLQLPSPLWDYAKYLPANAGQALFSVKPAVGSAQLAPWAGFAVLCAWAAAALGIAAWRITRRDA